MKTIKTIFVLLFFILLSGKALAVNIDNITAIDNNTVEVTTSSGVIFSDVNVEGDIKLLKDIPVSFSTKDAQDAKKVLLNLSTDLITNSSYSLISILGAEGNIDFKTLGSLSGSIDNPNLVEGEKGITKINIIDSRTVELYFTDDLVENTFEFKILSEIPLSSIKSAGDNKLTLEVAGNLEASSNYIVMVLNLKDISGNPVNLDEELFDFATPADLVQEIVPEAAPDIQNQDEPQTTTMVEPTIEPVPVEQGNVAEVAKATTETPETGTATNILFMIAFVLSFGLIFRRKFSKQ